MKFLRTILRELNLMLEEWHRWALRQQPTVRVRKPRRRADRSLLPRGHFLYKQARRLL